MDHLTMCTGFHCHVATFFRIPTMPCNNMNATYIMLLYGKLYYCQFACNLQAHVGHVHFVYCNGDPVVSAHSFPFPWLRM